MKFSCNTIVFSLLMAFLFLQGCDDNSTGPDFSNVPPPYDRSAAVRDSTLEGDLKIFVIEEGIEPFEVVPTDAIRVKYTGRTENGRIFDSTYRSQNLQTLILQNLTPGPKIVGPRSVSPLIEGFRKGLLGMKIGEKRIIEIPPSLGYDNSRPGTNGFDLRDKTLIFDVELVAIL